jgi:hypothetical protein
MPVMFGGNPPWQVEPALSSDITQEGGRHSYEFLS